MDKYSKFCEGCARKMTDFLKFVTRNKFNCVKTECCDNSFSDCVCGRILLQALSEALSHNVGCGVDDGVSYYIRESCLS